MKAIEGGGGGGGLRFNPGTSYEYEYRYRYRTVVRITGCEFDFANTGSKDCHSTSCLITPRALRQYGSLPRRTVYCRAVL